MIADYIDQLKEFNKMKSYFTKTLFCKIAVLLISLAFTTGCGGGEILQNHGTSTVEIKAEDGSVTWNSGTKKKGLDFDLKFYAAKDSNGQVTNMLVFINGSSDNVDGEAPQLAAGDALKEKWRQQGEALGNAAQMAGQGATGGGGKGTGEIIKRLNSRQDFATDQP